MGLLELEPCLLQQGLVSGSVLGWFWSKWFSWREPEHRVIYSASLSLTYSCEGASVIMDPGKGSQENIPDPAFPKDTPGRHCQAGLGDPEEPARSLQNRDNASFPFSLVVAFVISTTASLGHWRGEAARAIRRELVFHLLQLWGHGAIE